MAEVGNGSCASGDGGGDPSSQSSHPNSNRRSRWAGGDPAPPPDDAASAPSPPPKRMREERWNPEAFGYGHFPPVDSPPLPPVLGAGGGIGRVGGVSGVGGGVNILYKTKLCTRYASGSCTFNENCHFAHGAHELRKPPVPGWDENATGARPGAGGGQRPVRIRPCRYFLAGNCPYADRCTFLHNGHELPGGGGGGGHPLPPSHHQSVYKSRLCSKWERGEPCEFADKCYFAHGPGELQSHGNAFRQPYYNTNAPNTFPGMNPYAAQPPPQSEHPSSGSVPFQVPSTNSYESLGVTPQETVEGAPGTYGGWDENKKWENADDSSRSSNNPFQGSTYPEQWPPNYTENGAYGEKEDGGVPDSHYPPQQPISDYYPGEAQETGTYYGKGNETSYQVPMKDEEQEYEEDNAEYGVQYDTEEAWVGKT